MSVQKISPYFDPSISQNINVLKFKMAEIWPFLNRPPKLGKSFFRFWAPMFLKANSSHGPLLFSDSKLYGDWKIKKFPSNLCCHFGSRSVKYRTKWNLLAFRDQVSLGGLFKKKILVVVESLEDTLLVLESLAVCDKGSEL